MDSVNSPFTFKSPFQLQSENPILGVKKYQQGLRTPPVSPQKKREFGTPLTNVFQNNATFVPATQAQENTPAKSTIAAQIRQSFQEVIDDTSDDENDTENKRITPPTVKTVQEKTPAKSLSAARMRQSFQEAIDAVSDDENEPRFFTPKKAQENPTLASTQIVPVTPMTPGTFSTLANADQQTQENDDQNNLENLKTPAKEAGQIKQLDSLHTPLDQEIVLFSPDQTDTPSYLIKLDEEYSEIVTDENQPPLSQHQIKSLQADTPKKPVEQQEPRKPPGLIDLTNLQTPTATNNTPSTKAAFKEFLIVQDDETAPVQESGIVTASRQIGPAPLPGTHFPYVESNRVSRWSNAGIPLDPQVFPEYQLAALNQYRLQNNRPPMNPQSLISHQQQMLAFHGLCIAADRFYNIGVHVIRETARQNEYDMEYFVAAKMQLGNRSATQGVITWVISLKSNECYHKYFHINGHSAFIDDLIAKTFNKGEFPTLGNAMKVSKLKEKNVEFVTPEGEIISFDRATETFKIKSLIRNLELTLYPTQKKN